jgi:SAM-dependent methyltransferase
MDILNHLPPRRFREADDLLAFISIYDDARRTRAFRKLLRAQQKQIRGAVCVEGGCGLGVLAIEMAKLGARKVYAVEQNPLLAKLARQRIAELPKRIAQRIEVIETPLQDFRPPQKIDVLVHEFYGQLLYDEDLWVLENLKFEPRRVLPDGGELLAGVVSAQKYVDRVLTADLLKSLEGALVAGLFEEKLRELQFPVLRWKFGKGLSQIENNISERQGDLLCFGVAITHRGQRLCEAGRCPNWSYVWTPRAGDRFAFEFLPAANSGMACHFRWIEKTQNKS